MAVNFTLSVGSAISLGIGVLYLWVLQGRGFWPHYMVLSFLIFLLLLIVAVLISMVDTKGVRATQIDQSLVAKPSKLVWRVWIALIIIMIALYFFFNGY